MELQSSLHNYIIVSSFTKLNTEFFSSYPKDMASLLSGVGFKAVKSIIIVSVITRIYHKQPSRAMSVFTLLRFNGDGEQFPPQIGSYCLFTISSLDSTHHCDVLRRHDLIPAWQPHLFLSATPISALLTERSKLRCKLQVLSSRCVCLRCNDRHTSWYTVLSLNSAWNNRKN